MGPLYLWVRPTCGSAASAGPLLSLQQRTHLLCISGGRSGGVNGCKVDYMLLLCSSLRRASSNLAVNLLYKKCRLCCQSPLTLFPKKTAQLPFLIHCNIFSKPFQIMQIAMTPMLMRTEILHVSNTFIFKTRLKWPELVKALLKLYSLYVLFCFQYLTCLYLRAQITRFLNYCTYVYLIQIFLPLNRTPTVRQGSTFFKLTNHNAAIFDFLTELFVNI